MGKSKQLQFGFGIFVSVISVFSDFAKTWLKWAIWANFSKNGLFWPKIMFWPTMVLAKDYRVLDWFWLKFRLFWGCLFWFWPFGQNSVSFAHKQESYNLFLPPCFIQRTRRERGRIVHSDIVRNAKRNTIDGWMKILGGQ